METKLFKENLSENSGRFELVYNLYPVEVLGYLPNAYVVTKDLDGFLAHIRHRASKDTIGSFGLELSPVREQLFRLIDLLNPAQIEQKFQPNKRKKLNLQQLLEQVEIKQGISRYVHRKLDEFLNLIVKNDFALSWDVERKVLVKDFVLQKVKEPLLPKLFFQKTDQGVLYRFSLEDQEKVWKISSREVEPITNYPAWIFADYGLYKVAHINGNMVKPFRTKEEILIPKSSVKTYFQKFILKVAAKVNIEAAGFKVRQFGKLEACKLEPVKDLFTDQWVLSLQMCYAGATFNWSDTTPNRTSLEFGLSEEINIIQIVRDFEAEQVFVKKLDRFDLVKGNGSYFQFNQEKKQSILEWLIQKKKAIEKVGFTIVAPQMEGKTINLNKAKLNWNIGQENDWFDLKAIIEIGDHRIPFKKIAPFIRQQNRLFPLPDGTFFLIPEEWMAKFQSLVQFAKQSGEQLRLTKSQYTLLDELGFQEDEISVHKEVIDFQPSSLLKATLRPYQLTGAQWLVQLYQADLGACLADDMGLGKTLQTITALLHAKEQKKNVASTKPAQQLDLFQIAADAVFLNALNALIVLPASLVFNWESEIKKFAPSLSIYKHTGGKRYKDKRLIVRFDIILTTYQTALRDQKLLEQIDFEYIVLDESQQIKNKDSKIFKAINSFQANHKISLSGTPIENSLSDLWSQMQFINPELLGNYSFFRKTFINPIEKGQDEDKKIRLRKLVQPYLLRRTKEEVAKDLPPLTNKTFYAEMTNEQKKLYDREKSAARNFLLNQFEEDNPKQQFLVLQSLTKLRQLVNHPKLVFDTYQKESGKFKDAWEQLEVIKKGGHKVLVFSSFVQYLELFKLEMERANQAYAWLTGKLNAKQRQAEIQKFESDPTVSVFFISIKSGGTGLNLTAADYVFILDPWWNPSTEQQAIARAHRIGQDKNVFAIKFITKDSIEEKILRLQERKARLAQDIIEGADKLTFSKEDIAFLLE